MERMMELNDSYNISNEGDYNGNTVQMTCNKVDINDEQQTEKQWWEQEQKSREY